MYQIVVPPDIIFTVLWCWLHTAWYIQEVSAHVDYTYDNEDTVKLRPHSLHV